MGQRFSVICRTLFAALTLIASLPHASAREVETSAQLRSLYDWTQADRLAWAERSAKDNKEQLAADLAKASTNNSFVRTALANTQQDRPTEYKTIEQRRAYYDLMAQVLESSDATALRGIRFFHSAAALTAQEEAGTSESLPGRILGAGARKLLEDINRDLFSANLSMLRNLLFDWREPRQSASAAAVSPMVFEMAMVDREQDLVERALAERGYPSEVIGRINFFLGLAPSLWSLRFSPVEVARRWTARAGYEREDFANRSWRVAMGRSLVFFFHGFKHRETADEMASLIARVRGEKLRM